MAPSRGQGRVSQVLLVPAGSGQIFCKTTGSAETHSAGPPALLSGEWTALCLHGRERDKAGPVEILLKGQKTIFTYQLLKSAEMLRDAKQSIQEKNHCCSWQYGLREIYRNIFLKVLWKIS